MTKVPKKCSECAFRLVNGDDSLSCEILYSMSEPTGNVGINDEPPINCPLATYKRFRTLCEQCIVEDYNADSGFDEYSIRLPMFYNNNVALTLDYLGGDLGRNPTIESWLESKALFGRKPDDGYYSRVNLETGEVVDVGHQHNPIKDMEARKALAREKRRKIKVETKYRLQVNQISAPKRVEIWQGDLILRWFDLENGRSGIYVDDDGDVFLVGKGAPLVTAASGRLLFHVEVVGGKVWSYTDFQPPYGKVSTYTEHEPKPKPTLEDRVAALEKHLGL